MNATTVTKDLPQLATALRELREEHRLSLRELAGYTEIPWGTLASWENGRAKSISVQAANRLADAYDLTTEEVMNRLGIISRQSASSSRGPGPLPEVFVRIRRLRESLHLSQQEFADMSDISKGTIAAWETGRVQDIDLGTIRKLAKAHGMTLEAMTTYLAGTDQAESASVPSAVTFTVTISGIPYLLLGEVEEFINRRIRETKRL